MVVVEAVSLTATHFAGESQKTQRRIGGLRRRSYLGTCRGQDWVPIQWKNGTPKVVLLVSKIMVMPPQVRLVFLKALAKRPIWRSLIWPTMVHALFFATANATPHWQYPQNRDPGSRLSGVLLPAGIHLSDSNSGLNGRENLGAAAAHLLSDLRETHYQHRTHVDQAEGVYDMDCSGFVDYLLRQIAPAQFAQLRVEPGHARPRAAMYFELFNRLRKSPLPGWEAVEKLGDAQRGDILAWELAASTQEPGDTGHVVIVAAPPVRQANGYYRVEVFDSSAIHHDDDSRPQGTGGVGKGIITFKVNPRDEPVGFRFNSRANFHSEAIGIGRLLNS